MSTRHATWEERSRVAEEEGDLEGALQRAHEALRARSTRERETRVGVLLQRQESRARVAGGTPDASNGMFLPRYVPPRSAVYLPTYQQLAGSGILESFANGLSARLRLPSDVEVVTRECGVANAFYNPATRRISFCYELMHRLGTQFGAYPDPDALYRGTFFFILFHELGHALTHVLHLPVTGREEDAADQLAVLFLLEQPSGAVHAYSAASWFAANARNRSLTGLAFADEHSLDEQRFFNVICWVYGKDVRANAAAAAHLSQGRRPRCPKEYNQMALSWHHLLEPHTR